MTAPPSIHALIARFNEQREDYQSPDYKELRVRNDLINPFFEALGWDVANEREASERYRDVIVEESTKVEGSSRSPDYTFRIGGTPRFYVEAKKPSVNLKTDPRPAFQLRSYGWTRKLPLSVLTDFHELAVYDTRVEPKATDGAGVARVLYYTYDQYVEKWSEIYDLLSYDAVLKGKFDRFAETNKPRRGTTEFDTRFLHDLESWRKKLAEVIAASNPTLDVSELNYAVQSILDRIVFLRIAEDRGLESFGKLRSAVEASPAYEGLVRLFKDADNKYNSGLFHFRHERNRAQSPDRLTLQLDIPDKSIRDIVTGLYAPKSPYAFKVVPADILGQVYERFLGRTISLTARHKAEVVLKPELRKAKGVYYTPSYIVREIVERTVGPKLKGKTLQQVSKLRIVDPACGSGSFLIVAYQTLLDWHLATYVQQAESFSKGRNPKLVKATGNEWRLTLGERKRILLQSVFGVDIDRQAVEVTKLSLLLKLLEDGSEAMEGGQFRLLDERVLPDLDANIQTGNSLVGTDVLELEISDPDEEQRSRISPFDWNHHFPKVFANGGFDAVIGNPPYAYRNATESALRPYYDANYETVEGNYDLYKFFLERSVFLVKKGGRVGMIVSATFLVQPSFKRLRSLLLSQTIDFLAPLGPKVFQQATVDTALIVLTEKSPTTKHRVEVRAPIRPRDIEITPSYFISQKRFLSNPSYAFDYRLSDELARIVDRLVANFPTIETGFEFGVGINTGYIKDELISDTKIDNRYHRMVPGTGISRYGPVRTKGWIMYDADFVRSRGKLGRSLPAEHLLSSDKILVVRTRNLALDRRIVATLDDKANYNLNRLSNIVARPGHSLLGLLGILNSTLMNWLFSTRFFDYEIKPVYLRQIPMADVNDAALETLVRQMLVAQSALAGARSPDKVESLSRRARVLDEQIDHTVYRLYGLTDSEVTAIEAAASQ